MLTIEFQFLGYSTTKVKDRGIAETAPQLIVKGVGYVMLTFVHPNVQCFQNKLTVAGVPPANLSFTAGYFSLGQSKIKANRLR